MYDDNDDAALGVSFSSKLLGLTALMSLCPSPSAFLLTIVQCQGIKLFGLLLTGLPFCQFDMLNCFSILI